MNTEGNHKIDNDEIDLAILFKAIKKGINNFYNWIGNVILVTLIFSRKFLVKNFYILLLSIISGSIIGATSFYIKASYFETTATIRTKFLKGFYFKSEIEKINNLCRDNNIAGLEAILNISKEEAYSIKSIEVSSFKEYNYNGYSNLLNEKEDSDSLMEIESRTTDFVVTMGIFSDGSAHLKSLSDALINYLERNVYLNQEYQINQSLLLQEKEDIEKQIQYTAKLKETIHDVIKREPISSSTLNLSFTEKEDIIVKPLEIIREERLLNQQLNSIKSQLKRKNKIEVINDFLEYDKFGSEDIKDYLIFWTMVCSGITTGILILISINKLLVTKELEREILPNQTIKSTNSIKIASSHPHLKSPTKDLPKVVPRVESIVD